MCLPTNALIFPSPCFYHNIQRLYPDPPLQMHSIRSASACFERHTLSIPLQYFLSNVSAAARRVTLASEMTSPYERYEELDTRHSDRLG
jgi:hypothetical protein